MAGPLTPTALGVSGADAVVRVHGAVVQVVLERDAGEGTPQTGACSHGPVNFDHPREPRVLSI